MKHQCDKIRKDLEDFFKEYGKENNLKFTIGTMRYGDTNIKFYTEVTTTEMIDGKSVEQIEFEKLCRRYDLKESDYRSIVTVKGLNIEIVGFNPRKPKFSIKGRILSTGKLVGLTKGVLKQIN